MSKKPTVTTIASGFYSTSALNDNFTNIRDQFDNTLSLDGSTPNAMGADLDMNSNDILNGGIGNFSSLYLNGSQVVSTGTLFTFEGTWLTATAYQVNDVVIDSGSTYLCLVAHTSGTFATDLAASKWVELIDSTAYLRVANNLSDVANAATSRTNLGLGTAATTASTDYATAAQGATADAAQPGDATLTSLSGLSLVAGDVLYATGADTLARLAKGTAGQLLEMNSGATAPAWASGGLQFISSTDLSSVATCDFTGWGSLNYDYFVLVLGNVIPATDGATLQLRTTADDVTFDSGASNYLYAGWIVRNDGTSAASTGSGNTEASIGVLVGSAAGEDGVSGTITIFHPHLARDTIGKYDLYYQQSDGLMRSIIGGFNRNSSAAVTGVRLLFSTGNLSSGTVTLYGGRNA